MNILEFQKQAQLIGIVIAQAIGEQFDINAFTIERNENADFSLVYYGSYIVAELPIEMDCDKLIYDLRGNIILSLN